MKDQRQLFVIPSEVLAACSPDEVLSTAETLIELDLYKLPYPVVDVECSDDAVKAWCRREDAPAGHLPVTVRMRGVTLPPSPFATVEAVRPEHTVRPIGAEEIRTMSETLSAVLIVLLATRNVVKSVRSGKLSRLGIGKKNARSIYAQITTISLPYRDLEDGNHSSINNNSVRPHLRRGHVRRQRSGTGLSETHVIFVPPVFVNADPDYVPARGAYWMGPRRPPG